VMGRHKQRIFNADPVTLLFGGMVLIALGGCCMYLGYAQRVFGLVSWLLGTGE
jgi:hypothetical protein